MSRKRIATSTLDHKNWDKEEKAEEAGSFTAAPLSVLRNRPMKFAMRRQNASQPSEQDDSANSSSSSRGKSQNDTSSSSIFSSFGNLVNPSLQTKTSPFVRQDPPIGKSNSPFSGLSPNIFGGISSSKEQKSDKIGWCLPKSTSSDILNAKPKLDQGVTFGGLGSSARNAQSSKSSSESFLKGEINPCDENRIDKDKLSNQRAEEAVESGQSSFFADNAGKNLKFGSKSEKIDDVELYNIDDSNDELIPDREKVVEPFRKSEAVLFGRSSSVAKPRDDGLFNFLQKPPGKIESKNTVNVADKLDAFFNATHSPVVGETFTGTKKSVFESEAWQNSAKRSGFSLHTLGEIRRSTAEGNNLQSKLTALQGQFSYQDNDKNPPGHLRKVKRPVLQFSQPESSSDAARDRANESTSSFSASNLWSSSPNRGVDTKPTSVLPGSSNLSQNTAFVGASAMDAKNNPLMSGNPWPVKDVPNAVQSTYKLGKSLWGIPTSTTREVRVATDNCLPPAEISLYEDDITIINAAKHKDSRLLLKPVPASVKTKLAAKSQDGGRSLRFLERTYQLNMTTLDWLKILIQENLTINIADVMPSYIEELSKLVMQEKERQDSEEMKLDLTRTQTKLKKYLDALQPMVSTSNSRSGASTDAGPSPAEVVPVPSNGSEVQSSLSNKIEDKKVQWMPTPSKEAEPQQLEEQPTNPEDEPPKVTFTPVVEEGFTFTLRCKVFIKKNDPKDPGDTSYQEKGVGSLFVKPITSGRLQLIVRADTSLGNVLINTSVTATTPVQLANKNSVLVVCIPTTNETQPRTVLLRVKTPKDAQELIDNLKIK